MFIFLYIKLYIIRYIEFIASGHSIREISRLKKTYGKGNWKKLKGLARVRLSNGEIKIAELHCYEAHGIGKKNLNVNVTWNSAMNTKNCFTTKFVVCIKNENYPVSLELYKIYRKIPDADAIELGDIRIIDESG